VIVALTGGIGGAKLVLGLARVLPPEELAVVVNTGDDFEHFGLSISPDIDTVVYTLAGLANREYGWGRQDETWSFMETIGQLGGPTWFRLGDRDLAMHIARTQRLRAGETLSAITADLARRLGVAQRILPMSDDPVRTELLTETGWMDFQDYFVGRQSQPRISAIRFRGAEAARASPDFLAALADERIRGVAICPSNPLISVDPILAIPGVREALAACRAPVVAVSPVIGGKAVKGPTVKMMAELGLEASARAVAARYGELIDGFVLDHADAADASAIRQRVTLAATLMTTLEDREALARVTLNAVAAIGPKA
jgi:LPPG:FO 2-phospho-L-lactate transferase